MLQSQLWQPLNLNTLQPQLAETNLGILEGAGPSDSSFNEFNPLFVRQRVGVQASGIVGGDDTWGDDLVVSALKGPFSFSVGQFHYESDGFRDNNDQEQDIYNIFAQVAVTPSTYLQAELRTSESDKGDLGLRFDPDNISTAFREQTETDTYRLGVRHDFSPSSQIIGSYISQDFQLTQQDAPVPIVTTDFVRDDDPYSAEIQHVYKSKNMLLIGGLGQFESDSTTVITTTTDFGFPVPPIIQTTVSEDDNKHINAYLYSQLQFPEYLNWIVGASYEDFDGRFVERNQFNPKFGVIWQPVERTVLRAAAFRTLKRALVANQTIEPTQVAGFNQFYDDEEGADAKRYGVALDQRLSEKAYAGIEASIRQLDVPFLNVGVVEEANWDEEVHRAYFYWLASERVAVRAEYLYESLEFDQKNSELIELTTQRLPLGVTYSHPMGVALGGTATYIDQKGEFFDTVALSSSKGRDGFWVVDATISYRLPKRYGLVSVQAKNLFDESFHYQDVDSGQPTLYPEQLFFLRLTLAL